MYSFFNSDVQKKGGANIVLKQCKFALITKRLFFFESDKKNNSTKRENRTLLSPVSFS